MRLGLGSTIGIYMDNLERDECGSSVIARCLGISSGAAQELILEADALIQASAQGRVATCDTLPRMVCALLETHPGIVYDYDRGWTSEELRAGPVEGLAARPIVSIAEEYERSDAVFVGEVVAEQHVPESTEDSLAVKYTLNVNEVLRGNVPRTMRVFSEHGRYFPMVVGKTYILFVSHALGRPTVDDCGNSGSLVATPDTLTTVRRLMQQHEQGRSVG